MKSKNKFLVGVTGTFIMLLADFNLNTMLLSSDSIGQLRIYYKFFETELSFSSQISLLNSNGSLSKFGIIQYLLLDHYLDENTIFEDIKRIDNGTILILNQNSLKTEKYFSLFDFLVNQKNETKISYKDQILEIANLLKSSVKNYTSMKSIMCTLTGGLDSRLLLATLLSNNQKISAFTFGVPNNMESMISHLIAEQIEEIDYDEFTLEEDFENYSSNYFDYINKTKNIEMNFHRFHYVYIWDKKLNTKKGDVSILTGICGDSFVRDGISTTNKSDKFIYKMSLTTKIDEEIINHINNKKRLLNELEINENESIDYLMELFRELRSYKDPYLKHYYIKIVVRVLNYFGIELSTENSYLPTFTPFLELYYLRCLSNSSWSIFNYPFIENSFRYRLISQKFYAELINYLYKRLLLIKTNRGFPLRYSLSKRHLIHSLYMQNRFNHRKKIGDLNYREWREINFACNQRIIFTILTTH